MIARESLLTGAPVFVAALVWLLRVLLIGTFTLASHRRRSKSQTPVQLRRAPNGKRSKRTLVAQPISQR